MHVHLPEADFGKLRIWRPKEVLYRYDHAHRRQEGSDSKGARFVKVMILVEI